MRLALRSRLRPLRPVEPSPLREVFRDGHRKAFLFVSGPPGYAARYRCHHPAEALAGVGYTADVAYRARLNVARTLDHYACVVLYRVPWDDGVARLLSSARQRGVRVLCDFDDLVFDPDRLSLLRGLDRLPRAARREYERATLRLQRTLGECDAAVVSTDPLKREAVRFAGDVRVVPNLVTDEMLAQAEYARRGRYGDDVIRVVYASGTDTHDRDFAEAADAIVATLDAYPNVRFLAVGFLELDRRFERFGERVVRIAYQPWQRLPRLLAHVDINLAPLERDNAFTESKSCLKFLEAAVVGVPTVASPRDDFVRAIVPGVNGLLADDAASWTDALARLIDSPDERRALGERARADVLAAHTTRARAGDVAEVFAGLARTASRDHPLSIGLLAAEETGEVAQAADVLRKRGHQVQIAHAIPDKAPTVDVVVAWGEQLAEYSASWPRRLLTVRGDGINPEALDRMLREAAFARLTRWERRSLGLSDARVFKSSRARLPRR